MISFRSSYSKFPIQLNYLRLPAAHHSVHKDSINKLTNEFKDPSQWKCPVMFSLLLSHLEGRRLISFPNDGDVHQAIKVVESCTRPIIWQLFLPPCCSRCLRKHISFVLDCHVIKTTLRDSIKTPDK